MKQKRLDCPLCIQRFARPEDLQVHLMRSHNGTIFAPPEGAVVSSHVKTREPGRLAAPAQPPQ